MKKTLKNKLPVNFTLCFSIYFATKNEIHFAINGKFKSNMIKIGMKMEFKNENYVETLIFYALDNSIYKEAVLSKAAEIPSWRTICSAIETKTYRFVIAVDNEVKMDFVLPALDLIGGEFPDKAAELIEGPAIGFMGKITFINIHDNYISPENIECGAPGSILKYNYLDWNVDQLFVKPPDPNSIKNIPDQAPKILDLTPAFTICFDIFIVGGNYIEMNFHQGNPSGMIQYKTKNKDYIYWEEYINFGEQEKMVSEVMYDFFPQWRNICIRIDTVFGETNVTVGEKLVLNNYVVKDFVNSTNKLPKSPIIVFKTIKWKYPSDLKNLNLYSKFQNNYSDKKGDIYKWNVRDWGLDETLKTLIRKTFVKKEEICGKNQFIINNYKLPFKNAENTCQLIGKLSSSIRDLARTTTADPSISTIGKTVIILLLPLIDKYLIYLFNTP